MSDRTEHVETLQGQGQLILPDRVGPVGYSIRVIQNYRNGAPMLKEAAGRLEGLDRDDIVFSVLAGQPLELVLEDGRRAKILLAGLDGDFEVTGPFAW